MGNQATDDATGRRDEGGEGSLRAGTARGSAKPRLPRGQHGIPADLIARNQAERIIAAMAEVSSEQGYAGTTVRGVVNRAGVSSATFYSLFKSLEDCAMATFWELHGRLMAEVEVACRTEVQQRKPVTALRRSLQLFATDIPAARLMTVEILGAGERGARCQHRAIGITAERIGIGDESGWGRVALVSTLVARRVVAEETEKLLELESELNVVLDASKRLG